MENTITFKVKINKDYLKEDFFNIEQAKKAALLKRNELTKKTTKGSTFDVSVVKIELNEFTVIKNDELEKELCAQNEKEEKKERFYISISELLDLNEFELYYLFKNTELTENFYTSKIKHLFSCLNQSFLEKEAFEDTFLTMNFPIINSFCQEDFFVREYIQNNFELNSFYPKIYFNLLNKTKYFSILNMLNYNVFIKGVTINKLFQYFIDNELNIYNEVVEYGVLLKDKIQKVKNKIKILKESKEYFISNNKINEIDNEELKIVCGLQNESFIKLIDLDIDNYENKFKQLNNYLNLYDTNNEGFKLQIKSIIDKINYLEIGLLDNDFSHLEELKLFIDNEFVYGNGMII